MLKAQIDNLVSVSKVNNHISESIKNIQMIKSFSKESYMEKKYNEYLIENYETIERVTFYDSIFSPIILVIRSLIIALIVILSSEQLNFLGVSVGMIAASIELISNLFTPIENLGMELQNIQQSISGIYRVNEFYEISEDAKYLSKINNDNENINLDNEIKNDIESGYPFEIRGCENCNRPYYNERPGSTIYNYSRSLNEDEIQLAIKETNLGG